MRSWSAALLNGKNHEKEKRIQESIVRTLEYRCCKIIMATCMLTKTSKVPDVTNDEYGDTDVSTDQNEWDES